jgi:hypothetical protein
MYYIKDLGISGKPLTLIRDPRINSINEFFQLSSPWGKAINNPSSHASSSLIQSVQGG